MAPIPVGTVHLVHHISTCYFSGEKNKTKLTPLYCQYSVTLIVVGERPRSLSDVNQNWDF